ncbi:MAG: selenocysteine-specific translation elongation factor [Proteobacteria bacterium]|nr:selenocysteine-specific translation elongation factor [Pseudomonadota bacterium]MBU1717351.1 selenocysteine-specific translation elongation factor [Pseudomonadota bacterium]
MREIVLGTAGHVDHGKTSLVRALTGIDTDRLKEEKKRGITIELGFAFLDLPCGHRLGIVDVPGHERFVKNMVAGAASVDLVAFVIAADEGIMPQTREHFEICRLLGVKRGLIVLTKKDMVDPEWLALVQDDVREYFADSFLAEAPLVTVSSITGEGIDQVKSVLDQLVAASEFYEVHGPFRLPVDRIFSMKGFGAVVTGTSISGRLKVGEEVTFYPSGHSGRVRGIQVHSADVEEVEAGKRTAINIQGVEKEMIQRGDMLATPGCLDPTYMLDADFLYLSGNKKTLKNRTRVRVHLGTAEIMGRIVLLNDEELAPGDQANVQLLLEVPVGTWPGDRYVVRSYSPVNTIGGGEIFSGSFLKRRRFKEVNQQAFELYRKGNIEEIILLHLRESGIAGLTFDQISVKTGIFGKKLKKIIDPPISARRILVIDSEKQRLLESSVHESLKKTCCETITSFHAENPLKDGVQKEELRSRLHKGLDQKLFQFLLADLVKEGTIVQDEAIVRLAGYQIAMAADTEKLRQEMESFYVSAGLNVPTIKELLAKFANSPEKLVLEVLEVMTRELVLTKISQDLYYHTSALNELEQKMVDFLQKEEELDAQIFKTMTGLSRKFSIPLLEYFDKVKVTLRVGDKRILRERHKA